MSDQDNKPDEAPVAKEDAAADDVTQAATEGQGPEAAEGAGGSPAAAAETGDAPQAMATDETSADGETAEPTDGEPGDAEAAESALTRDIERVTALFTRSDASVEALGGGAFRFARWKEPIRPAFFGLAEDSVALMQSGFKEAAELCGAELAGEDSDAAPNILVYAVEDWRALRDAPQLAELVPDLDALIRLLSVASASQYRIFTFTPEGGLRFCVSLLRYDETLEKLSAPSLALGQAVQALLLWSDEAFAGESPVTVRRGGKALVKSRFARLLKAAYAAETPAYSEDPALAAQLAEAMWSARRSGEDGDRDGDEDNSGASGEKSEDVGRRRRTRRRRERGEDRAKADADASGTDEPSDEQSGGAAASQADEAPQPAFDPLGGDPRPPVEEPEASGADEEERSD